MVVKTFSEELREAVRNASVSRYQISKATGISEANLSRLVHGTGGLRLETLDKLIDYLGMELRPKKRKG
ncbi:MAG: helix-turn-helix domain-containing protein [Pirellulales bacterium]